MEDPELRGAEAGTGRRGRGAAQELSAGRHRR